MIPLAYTPAPVIVPVHSGGHGGGDPKVILAALLAFTVIPLLGWIGAVIYDKVKTGKWKPEYFDKCLARTHFMIWLVAMIAIWAIGGVTELILHFIK